MYKSIFFFACILVLLNSAKAQKQTTAITPGQLTFTVKTVSNGSGYSPKHVLSIWIKDEAGNFIVSRKVMAASRKKHLVKWVASSAYNTTSATTGATLNSHQTHTITWDGKDANGIEVQDGTYQVWVEYTSQNSANGQPAGPSMSVSFHKGPVAEHLTPASLTYFQDMVLDWVPLGVGTEEVPVIDKSITVYPNPFSESAFIRFTTDRKSQVQASIRKADGSLVCQLLNENCQKGEYLFEWNVEATGNKTIKPGIYILHLTINGHTYTRKLIYN
jgi:flagellar hook assembly protein FlgD